MIEHDEEKGSVHDNKEDSISSDKDPEASHISIRHLWAVFRKLSTPYWKKEPTAKWRLLVVSILALMRSVFNVFFSFIARDFWNALSERKRDVFYRLLLYYVVVMAMAIPVSVYFTYFRDQLGILWREWLTSRTLAAYFSKRRYYEIEKHGGSIDNPDQRISEDISSFTNTSLRFILTLIVAVIDLICFLAILLSIYPPLFFVLTGYAAFGTFVTILVGKRLISLNLSRLRIEADFRFGLIRIRENAESIAFYNGERSERTEVERRFTFVVLNFEDIICYQRSVNFFTKLYEHIIQVLPILILAPLYFDSDIKLGVITQAFHAFKHVLTDLSIVVNQFESLSLFSAGMDRLGEFAEALSILEDNDEGLSHVHGKAMGQEVMKTNATSSAFLLLQPQISIWVSSTIPLGINELSIYTPDEARRCLIHNLTLELPEKHRLLIAGISGSGKSSLLRALAGLWKYGRGRVARIEESRTCFLPQRPYCTLGNLREQITYPRAPMDLQLTDEQLIEGFKTVNLRELPDRFIKGLDAEQDWSSILSLGEQQRLAFCRLIVNKPQLVFLDEATSAMDMNSERSMYSYLTRCGTSFVSVGHRPSLLLYHDSILRLTGDGEWTYEPISQDMRRGTANVL